MARSVSRAAFLDELHARSVRHREILGREFGSRSAEELTTAPAAGEWSVAQCFDHLAATYDYYRPRLEAALGAQERGGAGGGPSNDPGAAADGASSVEDDYRPSMWGRVYMFFALNPRWSFKAAEEMAPGETPGPEALAAYEERLDWLEPLLGGLEGVSLSGTRVPLQGGVSFNFGDCLRVLVYHDALHVRQARKVLAAIDAAREGEQA